MMTLITGGSKCGKSHLAETLLDDFAGEKFYIATMHPFGEEAHAAIARHQAQRAQKHFITIEQYTDIAELTLPEGCAVLLECMGNLCANEMFRDTISDPADKIISGIRHLQKRAAELVIVSNEVGADGITYTPETNLYIAVMGELNRRTAALADTVIECVYGIPVVQKGALLC